MFGDVTESAGTGDTLTASANEDTILIGTSGKADEYVVDMTGATGTTEAWIYGLDTDLDGVTVGGFEGVEEDSATTTNHVLADGQTIQKVSYQGTNDPRPLLRGRR